ncbi:hypothetical protein TrVE_jg13929 [Triparma verrucosa]|uniref:Uncharacterized protein n=1 Tax=Triparma verrucosa TaxID=1606542 RepID=A0A9W7B7W7_9STRA|nr:hypothetical protein TrVE_jg13929 [Triparma verrucosa]|eukprot:CAMPEP_0182492400 /NCGR_PEP_ID=MMETSP1321-20130603/1549_1 /TAXON_ID=91990 /ORGANISM="Bolidomonas sp., Strain RCC1657" /LENGTH=289 /DNA_ID=CAMNT_0024694871 /DNA_START=10 /DNA_END=879 /DNA_ORIENTATION=-
MNALLLTLLVLCLLCTVHGQFGLKKKKDKKNKSAFEKAQESAQKGGVASGLSGMDASALGDMDLDALMASLSPEEVAQMEQLMKDMGDVDMGAAMDQMQAAMQELAKMSPEELANSMAEVMQSPEIQDMLNDPATMLQQMKGSGLMDDAQIDEYLANPKKYEKEMKQMTSEMMKVFSDPSAMAEIATMMSGIGEMLADPEKMQEALMDIAAELEDWETALSDDEKIEEARQQLLKDPDLAENPALASVFDTKEMREIINDPKKWRKQVKEGQEMLKGGNRRQGGVMKDL